MAYKLNATQLARIDKREGVLTIAAIEYYVRQGYSLEVLLRKYGYLG